MSKIFYIPAIFLMLILIPSCDNHCIDGNGRVITQQRTMGPFNRVESNGEFEVYIYKGSDRTLEIEADENLMGQIITRISHNELIIETSNNDCLNPTRPVKITLSCQEIKGVDLNGSGRIWCDSTNTGEFDIELDGSGIIECSFIESPILHAFLDGSGIVKANGLFENTRAVIEGSGEIIIAGVSDNSKLNIIGSGQIKCEDLISQECDANISGSGIITVHAVDWLDVVISGSGMVFYTGNPQVTTQISGSGQVIKR